MPAEWQARQLSLMASDPGPDGKVLSLSGRSTVIDFSSTSVAARPANGKTTVAAIRTMPVITGFRNMISSSSDRDHIHRLDYVAHEPTRIPIGRVGLRLAAGAGASDHQYVLSRDRHADADLPLAEAVLALILAELRLVPTRAAIAGEI